MTSLLVALLAVVVAAIVIVPLALLHGWAFTTLWNWFIPGIFPALPELSVLQGIAMSFTLSALRPREVSKPKEGVGIEEAVEGIAKAIIGPLLIVCLGYGLKFWV